MTAPLALLAGPALAGECTNPNALGVSRTIVVDPKEHLRIGTMDYAETLPLADREVVLTFDDGPIPRYSYPILEMLAAECVKATYFMVGEMAKEYPDAVRRIYEAGHTIGTHSYSHPIPFGRLSFERTKTQIDGGFEATRAALGDAGKVAPFFRFPGFAHTPAAENYAAAQGVMVWGADVPADDWRNIGAKEVAKRAIQRLGAKGKGILLLHDIHQRTVDALPTLLRELKSRGFRIVHVVPTAADRPATETTAQAWRPNEASKPVTPVFLIAGPEDLDSERVAAKSVSELCMLNPPRERVVRSVREHQSRTKVAALRKKPRGAHVAARVEPAAPQTTGWSNAHAVQ